MESPRIFNSTFTNDADGVVGAPITSYQSITVELSHHRRPTQIDLGGAISADGRRERRSGGHWCRCRPGFGDVADFNLSNGTLITLANAGGGLVSVTSSGGGDIFMNSTSTFPAVNAGAGGSLTLVSAGLIDDNTGTCHHELLHHRHRHAHDDLGGRASAAAGSMSRPATVDGTRHRRQRASTSTASSPAARTTPPGRSPPAAPAAANIYDYEGDLLVGDFSTDRFGRTSSANATGASILDADADAAVDITASSVSLNAADGSVGAPGDAIDLATLSISATAATAQRAQQRQHHAHQRRLGRRRHGEHLQHRHLQRLGRHLDHPDRR